MSESGSIYLSAIDLPKSTATFASGGQNPFCKKGSLVANSQKLFIKGILGGLIFFVPLCVPLWLKLVVFPVCPLSHPQRNPPKESDKKV